MKDLEWLHLNAFLKGVLLLALVVYLILPGVPSQHLSVKAASGPGCGSGQSCIFIPVVTKLSLSANDLSISSMEITQAVQDPSNSVPLVAGRSTMLRINARMSGGNQLNASTMISVTASNHGVALTGGPQTITASLQSASNADGSTVNMPLPPEWLKGSYDLSITVDPHNVIAEDDENNNTFVQHVRFTEVPPLNIMIVPIIYTHVDGHTYPAPNKDTISNWIMRMYPVSKVNISWHTPYAFSGNMKDTAGFSQLLSEISAMKAHDNAPVSQVYYGLAPTQNGPDSWFSGGIVGIGYIGTRVAVGLDYANAGQTAAHEIGHNLGQYHAPCGSVSSSDANYPYPNASIGKVGLDLSTGTVYTPDSNKDIMSYCTPKWISDYTYKALYNSQILNGAELDMDTGDQPSRPLLRKLLFRARVAPEGVQFFPAYTLLTTASTESSPSPYTIQLVNAQGDVLLEKPVPAYEIASEVPDQATSYDIQAMVDLPEATVQRVRLLKDGALLGEETLEAGLQLNSMRESLPSTVSPSSLQPIGIQPAVSQTEQGWLRLNWANPSAPAMVRYTPDQGNTWTLLGLDVVGGTLDVDPDKLPGRGGNFQVILSKAAP